MNEIIDIQSLLNIAIVGVFLSFLLEAISSSRLRTNPLIMKGLTIGLSLIVSGVYVWLKSTPYFVTVMTILTAASTVYAFLFNRR